ncbi:BTAD domain-containing putative transcriptional regulator [Motilibacter rhizosphaerae]|uniref:BTAD domain-containing putative transcriptional regulator n=1 Tax=Motilibacter rhizosphaerae TaxID=598652 RepID=UPI0013EE9957|nr:BTAD domain-containing putative transcriptional regulator [Motilibacter rhizosphaerae]
MEVGPELAVLGAVEARRDGTVLPLGPPLQRKVLAALALHGGRPVTRDALVELVWGQRAPAAADNTIQTYLSGLRKVLEHERLPHARGEVIVRTSAGYALSTPPVDALRLESVVARVDQRLSGPRDATGVLPASLVGDVDELLAELGTALALWRGAPYPELGDGDGAVAERRRLEALRLLGLELRAALEVMTGGAARAAVDLETMTAAHPLRERLWALRAIALCRAGRQADALGVLAEVREVLARELGIDPGPELVTVQVAVLRQDPAVVPALRSRRPAPPVARAPSVELVGRRSELAQLVDLHEQVVRAPGPPVVALVTGEAGIGKSALVTALARRAEERGTTVVTARCPEDAGAPPLWAWSQLLRGAGVRVAQEEPADDVGAGYRARLRSVDALLEATGGPALLLVEDLQWADASTLQVLHLLATTEGPTRLLLVLTWRAKPSPAVRELAAALARRHAHALALQGLDTAQSAQVLALTSGTSPTPAQAQALHERTGGNPYFLVELARAARGDLDALVAGGASSEGITAALRRRIDALGEKAARTLAAAAVLGRDVEVATLTAAVGSTEDEVVEDLEDAYAAGLLQETGIDRFRFAHDLLRETARAGVTRSRAARLHAAAAAALSTRGLPGRESDLAHHWLAAGPAHASKAWRAAREAAAAARRLYAYDECAQLLRQALAAVGDDPAALAEDRCDLLLTLGDALRLGAQWLDLRPVVHEALAAAQRLGDLERVFTAATLPTDGAYWLASPYGQVDEVVVAALRQLLEALPRHDDPRRCRVMLSLASEVYYATGSAEREALVDEAVAMARRLGDDRLLLTACLAGATSVWRSARSEEQLALAVEAVALARTLQLPLALADALTVHVAAANDLGLVEELPQALELARSQARELELLFSQLLLDGIEIGWCAVRGEHDRLEQLAAGMARLAEPMHLAQLQSSAAAVALMRLWWSDRDEELLAVVRAGEQAAGVPVSAFVAVVLCRTGRLEEAAAYVARGLRIEEDDWLSPAIWSLAAECALRLRDPALASAVYGRLLPLAGRPATAGSGIVVGPTDAFLAMAALAVGERDTASRHASAAERVAERWRAEPVLRWVARFREEWAV